MIEEYYNLFLPDNIMDLINENEGLDVILLTCEEKLFASCLLCALLPVFIYYGLYTRCCFWGYHYRVRHWFGWMFAFFVMMTTIAWIWPIQELEAEAMWFEGFERIEWRLYWANVALYLITSLAASWAWCQFLPTNAYRCFKIGH